ncbi:sugar-binding domain-containing protein [Actinoallomurus acanthiterrae]
MHEVVGVVLLGGECHDHCVQDRQRTLFEQAAAELPGRCLWLSRRTLAITAEQLRKIPEVVAAAGGSSKARAIQAVLRGGLANSVVTDEAVARHLPAHADGDS